MTIIGDRAGNAVVDIWKVAYASAPPTVANTICAAAKPTLAAGQKNTDSTLSGWTTTVTAGDVFIFNVDSCATIQKLSVVLGVTKT